AGDEVRVFAGAHGTTELLALHQPRVVRHDGRAGDLSHDLLLTMRKARAERLLRNDHVLDVAEELEAPIATLAADTPALAAAERSGEVAEAEAIHPDEAGTPSLGHGSGVCRVAVADAAQAVVGPVGHLDRLVVAGESLQREHGAEYLVLHDLVRLPEVA